MADWEEHRRIGECDLYLGDSSKILPGVVPGGAVLLTDPPYGIDYGRAGSFKASHGWSQWREKVEWDSERPPVEVFQTLLEVTDEQIIWGGNYFADLLPPTMRWLVWDKGQRDFSLADGELAWTSQRKALRIFTYARALALRDGKVHPTQKPVALMEWCIGFLGSGVILDPFMGSGTTLVAAARMGRAAIGIECEREYFEAACRRVESALRQPSLPIATQEQMAPPQQAGFDFLKG